MCLVSAENAGETENVLPGRAIAIVDFQILTGDTIESVVTHVEEKVADSAVKVESLPVGFATGPPPVSDTSGPAFEALAKAVQQTLATTAPMVVPYILAGRPIRATGPRRRRETYSASHHSLTKRTRCRARMERMNQSRWSRLPTARGPTAS